jgi:predicted N-acetyltransferase YhbS
MNRMVAMSVQGDVTLRPMTEADIRAAHGLSVEAGWPHRAEDWEFLFRLGRGVVACDASGSVLGTAMWWPFAAEAGSIGMVIVSPKLQKRGIGRQMMRRMAEEAGPRTLRLTATTAGYRLYETEGFRTVGAIHQHQGTAVLAGEGPQPVAGTIRAMREGDRRAVTVLDRAAFGADRTAVFDQLAGETGRVCERGEAVVGFAFLRPFGRGLTIGPVVAEDDAMAIALVQPLVAKAAGQFLRIDTPVAEGPFVDCLNASGLPRVGGGTVMVRGPGLTGSNAARTYGLVNQALG